MKVAFLGNFGPSHSTENELRKAMEHLGWKVTIFQENETGVFSAVDPTQFDFILWVHTQFPNMDHAEQYLMLRKARFNNVAVVGYHLDIWHSLSREPYLRDEPFFSVDLLCTADGGHDKEFAELGINHHWFPPGVSEFECEYGIAKDEYRSDIAFIGSHDGGYHPESTHRHALVAWLQENYPNCKFWPQPGQPSVRGKDLQNLIASTSIIVGDSCMADDRGFYWSDRIPEILGRGGFLLHPDVAGLELHFLAGMDLVTWAPWDWERLRTKIDFYLAHPDDRINIAYQGHKTVLDRHTYTTRMQQLGELLEQEGLI